MRKNKLLLLLALLLTAVTGAWAQEGTLLTTILSDDNTDFKSGNKTFDNKATVTFSGEVGNEVGWGWYSMGGDATLTVTAAEGYTITRVKFYNASGSAFDEEAPFEAILVFDIGNYELFTKVNGTSIGGYGVTKIEVYGFAAPAASTYKVTMKDGVKDADKWTVKVGEGQAQALPIGGLKGDGTETVTLQYNGRLKVKGVKATSDAGAPAGPVTYTELKGGEVLHVGDIITPTEEVEINGGTYIMPSLSPYTVLRANITEEDLGDPTVTPADDGAYYVIQDKGGNYYFTNVLPATATSDGILVTYNGISWGYKQYTFSVHEP